MGALLLFALPAVAANSLFPAATAETPTLQRRSAPPAPTAAPANWVARFPVAEDLPVGFDRPMPGRRPRPVRRVQSPVFPSLNAAPPARPAADGVRSAGFDPR